MIKASVPIELLQKGSTRRGQHEVEFGAARSEFELGVRQFEFDRSIYSDHSVRSALATAQRGKCCFCEAKIQHISDGDVEHFRPKAAVRQARNAPLERPGYYWLAYEWSNLFFACQMCNQRNKQSLFPLAEPAARVRSHELARELERERPLFIDPGCDDPESLLGYRSGEPFAIAGNVRAETTIRELELGRTHLMERRWDLVCSLELAVSVLEWVRAGKLEDMDGLRMAAELLAARTSDDAEFASLARCLLRERLEWTARMPVTAEELIAYARGELGTHYP